MKHFIGGYTWDSTSQLNRFLSEGIWENGYGTEKYSDVFKRIEVGDKFALKSTSVKGKSGHKTSFLRIVKTGVVTSIESDSKLRILWDVNSQAVDIEKIKWYANTLEEITFPNDINRIFNYASIDSDMEKIINLLKYKHQVILQGPPGTGKTYTAKKIAKEMTKGENLGSAEDKIDGFFKTFDSSTDEVKAQRTEYSLLMQEFKSKFPADQLKDLTLQNYCIGTGERENFCWWLERGLKPLGYYFPGTSRSYMIYWDKSSGEYSTHFRHSKTLSAATDIEDAMHRLADIISDLVINKAGEAFKVFGDSLILKILHSYYPDEFFPVNSVKYLDNILKMMSVDASNLSFLEKNLKVQDIYIKKRQFFNRDVTSIEFMRFLADNFDLKGDIQIKEDSIIAAGEYKLIQFHPAYTYEDFVRGITAKTNKEGYVHYKVEDKTLAQFAQKADDNPSSNFVLIIDEINRANLPSVLGELIYALEYRYDKENPDETTVESMYALESDDPDMAELKKLKLPSNLYIIGTMNTADRSVGHIDYAIRRRFAFVEVLPKVIPELTEKGKELFFKVAALFCKEFKEDKNNLEGSEYIAPDFNPTDVMPGHSYFLIQDKEREELKLPDEEILKLKLKFEIKPILREYKKDGILLETAGEVIESLYV
jgi:DNA polymerase III delta prime subunit